MSEPITVHFTMYTVDADLSVEERDGEILLRIRREIYQMELSIDHEDAWRLSDAIARVVSRASVARASKEVAK